MNLLTLMAAKERAYQDKTVSALVVLMLLVLPSFRLHSFLMQALRATTRPLTLIPSIATAQQSSD
jgi:hypothetical protein